MPKRDNVKYFDQIEPLKAKPLSERIVDMVVKTKIEDGKKVEYFDGEWKGSGRG